MNKQIVLSLFFFLFQLSLHAQESFFAVFPDGNVSSVSESEKSTLTVSSEEDDFSVPETSTQKIISSKKNGSRTEITVETGDFSLDENVSFSDFLTDSRMLKLNSKEITAASKQITGQKDIIGAVEMFVKKSIKDNSPGMPIFPADDVLKTKTGDCKGHAVLAVSLLRKLGIPSRAVVGAIFVENFNDLNNVFVYHMWAEAYVSGKWVLVDATVPGKKHFNRYIAFSYHSLKTEAPLDYIKKISSVKKLKITVR